MVNIENIKQEIIDKLRPLTPDKIILFGSYAYGTPTEESDIDLFLYKNIDKSEVRNYKVRLSKQLRELTDKYNIGFDFIVSNEAFVKSREDYFYQKELLEKGIILYE